MCYRFVFRMSAEEFALTYGVELPAGYATPPEAYPARPVLAVGLKADGRTRGATRMWWGFVPRWAADPTSGPRPAHARAETVFTSPAFRQSVRDRRCLLPTDGFFEWGTVGGRKTPVQFRPAGRPVALAGVWDVWRPAGGGEPLFTCAVVTVPANEAVRPYHHRMPAVLAADQFARWLDPAAPVADLAALLRPYPHPLSSEPEPPAPTA